MKAKVTVVTETEQTQQSTVTGDLSLSHTQSVFPIKGHLMPGFYHTLIGVGPLCDADCAVTFTRKAVIVQDKQGTLLLTGWSDATWPRIWRIALLPGDSNLPIMTNKSKQATLAAYSAYDLTRVATVIRYLYSAEGYPVRSTWLKAIGAGN